jgi:Tol biopolymer transport system component
VRRLLLLVSLTACKASIASGMADAALDGAVTADARGDGIMQVGPWGTPTPVGITPVGDDDPSATADLLELYFNRSNDIYVAKRASVADAWGTPVGVAELNSADNETTPEVSYDGLTIYVASNRAGGLGGNDIWMATRATRSAAWSTPVFVPELSSPAADGAATQTDPLVIMIDSDRGGSLDILIAQRTSPTAAFGAPQLVTQLNGAESEGNPMLTSDKLTVYFDSNRTGDGELFVATRASDTAAFGAPSVIAELSSTSADTDPWISPDSRTMLFTSNRDGTQRLWQTTR